MEKDQKIVEIVKMGILLKKEDEIGEIISEFVQKIRNLKTQLNNKSKEIKSLKDKNKILKEKIAFRLFKKLKKILEKKTLNNIDTVYGIASPILTEIEEMELTSTCKAVMRRELEDLDLFLSLKNISINQDHRNLFH